MKRLKRLKIIIPHHNRVDRLSELLTSIPHGVEVHVVRGGTFAQNCNWGTVAEGFGMDQENVRYLFLNDDCLLPPAGVDFLHSMATAPVPIVGCRIQFPPDHETEERLTGGAYIVPVTEGEDKGLIRIEVSSEPPVATPGKAAIPSGCCFAIDADAFWNVGGFSERFQNGCEDIDLFLRCLEAGFQIGLVTDPRVHDTTDALA